MRQDNKRIEKWRVRSGPLGSNHTYGNNGCFKIPLGAKTASVMISDGDGWEHVSVSFADRCPYWDEMCQIKNIFWAADETVIQYHPSKLNYVNNHPHCLHLWRPLSKSLPLPPTYMVGMRDPV